MAPLLRHSEPTYRAYGGVHGYDVHVASIDDGSGDRVARRRARWAKVELLLGALATYDVVVWIDADAIICRFDRDIADYLPDRHFQALAIEVFPTRVNPNTGVWVLRRSDEAAAFLGAVLETGQPRHSWSDQAAVCLALGWHLGDYHGHGARPGVGSAFGRGTAWLPPEWNDVGARRPRPRIKHFAGMPLEDRVRRMAEESSRLRSAEMVA